MKIKHISISRLMDFMRCPRAYIESIRRAREKHQLSEPQVLGDVTHMLTAGEEPEAAREYIDVKLPAVAEERREEVMREAEKLADTASNMSAPEVNNERREVQLMWHDPETGYNIYAKPDELFYFDEQRGGRAISVMQITDVKSQAEQVKGYHWRQLYLFGLIATLALKYHHAIKLVVRLATPGIEETRWFSSAETWRQLHKLRSTLREIDRAWETGVFEHKPGGYCANCPLLASCEKGQAELLRKQQTQRFDDVAENDNGSDMPDTRVIPLPVAAVANRTTGLHAAGVVGVGRSA